MYDTPFLDYYQKMSKYSSERLNGMNLLVKNYISLKVDE